MGNCPPVLNTNRLRLRPLVAADGPRVCQLAGVRELYETTLNIPHPYEPGMAEKWIEAVAKAFYEGRGVTLAMEERDSGLLIGAISLGIQSRHQHAELGYWVGVDYWNCGYCSEATRAMLDFGFRNLNMHRIFAHHIKENPASGKVMQKAGMQQEGVLREHVQKDGVFHDLVQYGMVNPYKQDSEGGSP